MGDEERREKKEEESWIKSASSYHFLIKEVSEFIKINVP